MASNGRGAAKGHATRHLTGNSPLGARRLPIEKHGDRRSVTRFGHGRGRVGAGFEFLERRDLLAVVSVLAADAFAFESQSTGMFVFSRDGSLTAPLTLNYTLSGTATPGVDYQALAGAVTIPAGLASTSVALVPIADGVTEATETVTLTLSASSGNTLDLASATIRLRDPFFGGAANALVPLSETFTLHSLPGARHTIYLDFDGGVVNDPAWLGGGTINVNPFSIEGTGAFSDNELGMIQRVWESVAEDYRPFGVDVTTELPDVEKLRKVGASDLEWGLRVMIGDPIEYNVGATGRAMISSFNASYDEVAWVDLSNSGFTIKNARTVAGITSHEIGHALGLEHDGGSPGGSYYEGGGIGESDWSPIMGNIFPSVLTVWSQGSYPTADNPEDDLAVISMQNGFTYRPDDHANAAANASSLSQLVANQWRGEGTLERNSDVDYFTFTSTGGPAKILVTPTSVDPNVDLRAELFDASLTSLGVSDVTERLSASFDMTLAAGVYYVRVSGAGNRTWSTNGYDNYASLGAYSVDVDGVGMLGSFVPSNSTNSATPLAGVTQFPNVTLGALTLNGLGSSSNNNAWPIWVTGSASQDATKYVKFTVTPPSGEQVDLSKLTVTLQDWSSSTSTIAVRSSRDNFAANVDGTRTLSPSAGGDYWFDLSSVAADTGPVELRLYIWGSTTGSRELDSLKLFGRSRSTAPPPNIAPVANADSGSTSGPAIAINVLANDVDANGDALSVQAIGTPPAHGTVVVNADNTITYTPASGYAGSDAFTYTATDGLLASNVATVTVTVSTDDLPPIPSGTAPQFLVNQSPRLQLGDAPLVGFAGSQLDRISVLWQTKSAGTGTQDSFTVQYRLAGTQNAWQSSNAIVATNTGVEGRVVREASITGLQWDTNYEYRVRHLRAGGLVQQWSSSFRTRLQAGDTQGFSFVAYGDSASLASNDGFRQVQARINQMNPAFAVLLGDNVYESGTHQESDARFDPLLNPEAAAWMASHIDYLGLGNHDVIYSGHDGRDSEENFAVPVPIAGVNATVAPPATERDEHNFSWDYGDVHFVTFDTNAYNNPTRLAALLDYVVADLNASQARWKIVYGHHPIAAAPDKASEWDSSVGQAYYDTMVARLKAAGVDLLMFGHSHTFSWTYPLTGRDSSGNITYASGAYDDFTAGSGLPQLISGVGGKDLRSGVYSTEPYVAAGWTTSQAFVNGITTTSGQLVEDGIARVDVTQNSLTVSYIAADNGAVIGSFTIDYSADPPTDPPTDPSTTVTFQDGLNGYAGTLDVRLAASTPATQDGANVLLGVDGSPLEHTLVQFTNLFGAGANQIPSGATIQSAVLKVRVVDPGDAVSVHRMVTAWNESATWDSLVSGVQTDGVEAAVATDATFSASSNGVVSIDVTAALQAWAANPSANQGWVFLPGGTNGVDIDSSEATTVANRPSLTVAFTNTGGDPPTPHAPTAVNDSATTTEDVAVAVSVLTNDTDPDGDSLVPSVVTQPIHGTATVNPNGSITYLPAANYYGSDSFTYRVSDGVNLSNTATVALTVTPVNDAPTAFADSATTSLNSGVSIAVLTNDLDVDGDALTPSVVATPTHGTTTVNANGTISYLPETGYLGADSFTYRVFDGTTYSATATVSLTVNDSLASLAHFDPVGAQGSDNLAGTSSVAGATVGALTRVGATFGTNTDLWPVYWYAAAALDPAQYLTFSVTLPSTELADLGQLTVSFREWVTGTSNVAVRTSLDGFAANVGGVQLLTDTDTPDVVFDLSTLPVVGGTTVFRIYLYDGVDATAGWRDIRGSLSSAGKGVLLEGTTLPNHAPVANDDSATTTEDASVAINVLANDSDSDGQALTPTIVTAPAHGTATVNANGTITYSPSANYFGSDSFTYRVSDGVNLSNTATVALTVTPVNDAPTAFADSATTSLNVSVAIPVLTNDLDVDGDALTPSVVATPTHGTTTVNANGTISYLPETGYLGADSFTYRVFDGTTYSATATVSLTVNNNLVSLARFDPVGSQGSGNLAGTSSVAGATVGPLTRVGATYGTNTDLWPVYWYTAAALDPAQYLTFSVTLPSTDLADPGQLTVSFREWVTGTSNVAVRTSLDGFATNVGGVQLLTDTNTPDVVFDLSTLPVVGGTTVFRIYLYDGVDATAGWRDIRGSLSSAGKGVLLEGTTLPNHAPVANDDSATTTEDASVAINVLANDSDSDGQALTPSIVTAPAHGTATVSSNGTITYVPAANYFGADAFTYRVSDGGLNSAVATVNVDVTAVNDPPVVTNDAYSTSYQTTLVKSAGAGVLANDVDVEGSPLVATLLSGPSHGTLTFNADGSFQYVPATGHVGADSFTYSASDGVLAASGTVAITVQAPPDDHGNLTNSTATSVSLSGGTKGLGSASGVFEIAGDRDVFQVTVAKGSLAVSLVGANGLDTYLRVYNSAGTQIAFNDDSGASVNSALTLSVNAGTYYLSAGSKNDLSTGSYSLNVELKAQTTKSFQQNVNGYTSASDTYVSAYYPTTNFSTWTMNEIDYASATMQVQSLLQFKNLFGSGENQIPFGSELISATLTFYVTNGGNRVLMHRMLTPWTDAATWNSMTAGIQANGVEAATTADAQTPLSTPTGWLNLDVLTSVAAWAANPQSNNGWAMLPTGTDGVDYYSVNNNSSWSPKLTVDFLAPNGDLYVNTPTDAAPTLTIANNQASVFGSLEFVGDRDVFQFTLTQTRTVTIRLSAFGSGSSLDTLVRLYNDAATLVAEDDDSGPGTDSLLTVTLAPGRYFISAGSYLDQSIGDYWLELQM